MSSGRQAGAHRLPAYFWIYAAVAFLAALLVGLRPLNFVADDSLFYLVIADHVSHGDGSTFNGLFPTNGYHPLWELVVSALALLPHDKQSLALYGALVQWLLGVGTLWLLLEALQPRFDSLALTVFAAVMLLIFVPLGNLYWSEAALNMFFVAVTLRIMLSETPVGWVGLGVVLGLLFLSRLDNVFLIGCVIAALWLRDRDWRIAVACVACAAIAGIYLVVNFVQFGHLMPISGAIKSFAYRGNLFVGRLGTFGMVGLAGALGLALSNLLSRARPLRYRAAMLALSCGALLQCIYVRVLTDGDTTWIWYYVQGYLCVALVVAELATAVASRVTIPRTAGKLAFVLTLSLACTILAAQWWGWSWHGRQMHNVGWRYSWLADVQRAVSDGNSVLIVGDQPGLFAYGTAHPVYALDGLTSNYRLDAELAQRQMYGEIAGFGSVYLMAAVIGPGQSLPGRVMSQTKVPSGQIIHFSTPLLGKDAGCIFLDDAGLLASRAVPATLMGGVWGVWKLTPATMRRVNCE